jgi:hypothetical protein
MHVRRRGCVGVHVRMKRECAKAFPCVCERHSVTQAITAIIAVTAVAAIWKEAPDVFYHFHASPTWPFHI